MIRVSSVSGNYFKTNWEAFQKGRKEWKKKRKKERKRGDKEGKKGEKEEKDKKKKIKNGLGKAFKIDGTIYTPVFDI